MNDNEQLPDLAILAQYIKDLSLEVPHAPEIFTKLNNQPKLNVDLNIDVKRNVDNHFETTLNIRINADINEEKLFIFELAYAAECLSTIPDDKIEPILFIEIPKMLFPFARQIIASNLSNAGLPPLMLTPVDFAAVYKAKKEQEQTKGN